MELMDRTRARLLEIGLEALDLRPDHLLLSYDESGRMVTEDDGTPERQAVQFRVDPQGGRRRVRGGGTGGGRGLFRDWQSLGPVQARGQRNAGRVRQSQPQPEVRENWAKVGGTALHEARFR